MNLDPETVSLLQDTPGSVRVSFGDFETYALPNVRTVTEDFGGRLGVQVQRELLAIATGSLPALQRGSLLVIQPTDEPNAEPETRQVLYIRPKDDDPGLIHVYVEKP